MVKRTARLLLLLLLGVSLACVIAACGGTSTQPTAQSTSDTQSGDCRVVQHDAGTTEICGTPTTIAVLGPNALDLLLSLGEQPDAYADVFTVHKGDVFDNPSQQIPYLGDRITTQPVNLGDRDQPSLETLVGLKPDLILGEMGSARAAYGSLSQIAPTILWEQRTQAGKWKIALRQIAQALDNEERAEEAIAHYETLIQQARDEFAPIAADHSQVLLLGANNIQEASNVIKADSYLGEVFIDLGFELVTVPNPDNALNLSVEMLPTLAEADTIFVLGYDMGAATSTQSSSSNTTLDQVLDRQVSVPQQSWKASAIAQSLPASQEDRVFFATYYLWNGLNGPIGTELILNQLRTFFQNDIPESTS